MGNTWSTTLDVAARRAPARKGKLRQLGALFLIATMVGVGSAQAVFAAPGESSDQEAGGVDHDDGAGLVPAAHEEAIAAYWQERDAAFAGSGEAGVTFVASRLHPALGYSTDFCLRTWFPDGVPEGLRQGVTLREDTIAPAPDWRMPYGPLHDTELTDAVYRMHVQTVLTGLPSNVDVDKTVAVHLAVVDGRAYGFAACVEPSVARALIDQLASGPDAADPGAPTGFGESPGPVLVMPAGDAPSPAPPPAQEPPAAQPPAQQPPVAQPPRIPLPPPTPAPWPMVPVPDPTFPSWPGPWAPGEKLTVEQELFIALLLIDLLVQGDHLTVADAIEVLALLAEAPQLDDAQRALVEKNVKLLRDYEDDPQGDPPRLHLLVDPKTGKAVEVDADEERPDFREVAERATRAGCDLVLDVMDAYRGDCD